MSLIQNQDHHLRQLEYEVPLKASPLSELFGTFEDMKQQGKLEDFSVTQTTLDQVSHMQQCDCALILTSQSNLNCIVKYHAQC